jgi:Ca2+-binding RTX toxin-like protein
LNSFPFDATQPARDDLDAALAEVESIVLSGDAPVLTPMVPSEIGEIRFGNSTFNWMSITGDEVGLVGMGDDDTLIGGAGNDFLVGDYFDVEVFVTEEMIYDYSVTGNDLIYGGAGTDFLSGGTGTDTLYGGADSDTIAVLEENPGSESYYGGSEVDELYLDRPWSNDSFTEIHFNRLILAKENSIETLTSYVKIGGTEAADVFDLTGLDTYISLADTTTQRRANGYFDLHGGTDRFTGSGQAESVLGGNGNDTLTGNAGDDSLIGGKGDDSLAGGKGADLYEVNSRLDIVQEAAAQGIDLVKTSLSSYTLGANVENLTSTGSAGFSGTGNELKNTLTGNNFNDTLNGGLGNDTLTSFGGNDVFLFNTAPSTANVDTVTDFKHGSDHLHLENTGTGLFNKIKAGVLSEAAFKIIGTGGLVDADDRILYNEATGRLTYDADGAGSGAAVTFAFVDAGLNLTASDFLVI